MADLSCDTALEIIINYVVWWIAQPQYLGVLDQVEEYIRGYLEKGPTNA